MKKTTEQRLLERVDIQDNGCWIFTGQKASTGYGLLYVGYDASRRKRLKRYAHRVSYELFKGQIPAEPRHEIHHKCRVLACVNPDHLECLTRAEHARLNPQSTRPTCIHGHPRTPGNTYVSPRTGHRECRICGANAARRRRARIAAALTLRKEAA